MERKTLSKKLRFEIFKRDQFTCQYCGNHPPNVILECDHIQPHSKGGKDVESNLITSCFACNRGKSNSLLEQVLPSIDEKKIQANEKHEQLKAYQRLQRLIEKRLNKDEDYISDVYSMYFDDYVLNEKFKRASLRGFISKLPLLEVEEAMHRACEKINDSERAIRYFCGICWNKINKTNPWK